MVHEKGHLICEEGQRYEVTGVLKSRKWQTIEMKGHICKRKGWKYEKKQILHERGHLHRKKAKTMNLEVH